jgi:hypothetical protein
MTPIVRVPKQTTISHVFPNKQQQIKKVGGLSSKGGGVAGELRRIVAAEGVAALWAGNGANCIRVSDSHESYVFKRRSLIDPYVCPPPPLFFLFVCPLLACSCLTIVLTYLFPWWFCCCCCCCCCCCRCCCRWCYCCRRWVDQYTTTVTAPVGGGAWGGCMINT